MKSKTTRNERTGMRICAVISASTLMILGLADCIERALPSAPSTAQNDAPPVLQPVATTPLEPEAPVKTRPFVPCEPVTDCRIVAQHRLASAFAQNHGFYKSPSGFVASRHSGWEEHGRPEDTFFIEVTESCATGPGYYIRSGKEIWLPFEASCKVKACTDDPTGWEYKFEEMEVAHDAHRFVPLGHGFYDDGTHIFDRNETLSDDDVDRTTFHACKAEPEDPTVRTFYPAAEDSRGLFGYGDCGVLIRAKL